MVTQQDIADALGRSGALVSRWKGRGMPVDSIEAAAEWVARNVRARVRPVGYAVDLPLAEARRRREVAEALLAERRLEQMRQALVRQSQVDAEDARFRAAARARVLLLRDRVLTRVAEAAGDVAGIAVAVDAEAHAALSDLADGWTPGGGVAKSRP